MQSSSKLKRQPLFCSYRDPLLRWVQPSVAAENDASAPEPDYEPAHSDKTHG